MSLQSKNLLESLAPELLTAIFDIVYYSENDIKDGQLVNKIRSDRLLSISQSIRQITIPICYREYHVFRLDFLHSPKLRNTRKYLHVFCQHISFQSGDHNWDDMATFLFGCQRLKRIDWDPIEWHTIYSIPKSMMDLIITKEPCVLLHHHGVFLFEDDRDATVSLKRTGFSPSSIPFSRLESLGTDIEPNEPMMLILQACILSTTTLKRLCFEVGHTSDWSYEYPLSLPSLRILELFTLDEDCFPSLPSPGQMIFNCGQLDELSLKMPHPADVLVWVHIQQPRHLKRLRANTIATRRYGPAYRVYDTVKTMVALGRLLNGTVRLRELDLHCAIQRFPMSLISSNRDLRSLALRDLDNIYQHQLLHLLLGNHWLACRQQFLDKMRRVTFCPSSYSTLPLATFRTAVHSFPNLEHLDIEISPNPVEHLPFLDLIATKLLRLKSLVLRTETKGTELFNLEVDECLQDAQTIWIHLRSYPRHDSIPKMTLFIMQTVLFSLGWGAEQETLNLELETLNSEAGGRKYKQIINVHRQFDFHWSREGPLEPDYRQERRAEGGLGGPWCDADGEPISTYLF